MRYKPNKIIRKIKVKELSRLNLNDSLLPDMYIVNQSRGRCSFKKNYITVPIWALDRGNNYYTYYIAHELSHYISKAYKHDYSFYEVFIKICPRNCQKHELNYKPTSSKYGIKG